MDTDSPAAIIDRLGRIEQDLAELSPKLAYAAHQRVVYNDYLKRARSALLEKASGATKDERAAHVDRMLEQHGPMGQATTPLLDAHQLAEAAYIQHQREFELLDTRRSILQSMLKFHLREADPTGGPGVR